MRNLFNKLSRIMGPQTGSKNDAKKRLKFLLIHDQVDLTPGQLETMKGEIMDVIRKYLEIDDKDAEFELNREEGTIALVSTVPVRRVTGARA